MYLPKGVDSFGFGDCFYDPSYIPCVSVYVHVPFVVRE